MENSLTNKLKITGATLLSTQEADELPQHLKLQKPYGKLWWLRSPGLDRISAAYVRFDGSVFFSGHYVGDEEIPVRPALKLEDRELSGLHIGDRFEFGSAEFEIISDNLAFCTKDIGCCAFREDWKAKDANIYEASDVKKFIDVWFASAKNQPILVRHQISAEKSK